MSKITTLYLYLKQGVSPQLTERTADPLESLLMTLHATGLENFLIRIKAQELVIYHDEQKPQDSQRIAQAILSELLIVPPTPEALAQMHRFWVEIWQRNSGAPEPVSERYNKLVPITAAEQYMLQLRQERQERRFGIHLPTWTALSQLGLKLHGDWQALEHTMPSAVPPFGGPYHPIIK
ncbi:MAG TPA: hypothetical protein VJC05_00830 [Candidatus Andersenbacteria bacterium]|nr:hypothetical protein [Candidatus Andersenbacteria bacterium]